MTTELALPAPEVVAVMFREPSEIDKLVAHVEATARAHKPDVTTRKGREAIRKLAADVARSKTGLDDAGKNLNAALREQINAVDAIRREARDRLDALKVEVRQPLTDWETAEEARVETHKARIASIEACGTGTYDATTLRAALAETKAIIIDAGFEEFEAEAHRAKDAALRRIEAALAVEEQREAERQELERLRAEAAAREEADRKRQEAEAAEAKRIADEKAEVERQARIEREKQEAVAKAARDAEERARSEAADAAAKVKADQDRKDREAAEREVALKRQAEEAERKASAAAKAERDRIAEEKRLAAEAQAKREANARIRGRVIKEIADALFKLSQGVAGPPEHAIAEALADGKIPHTKVTF